MEEARRSEEYATRLLAGLQRMKGTGQLTDLNIMLDGNQAVYTVHKCVMVAASKYFAALVRSDQLSDSHCLIKGVEESHWASLLDFIYTGQLMLNADSCFTLHSAAHQLGIDEAVTLCEQYISDHNLLEERAAMKLEKDTSCDENDTAEDTGALPELAELAEDKAEPPELRGQAELEEEMEEIHEGNRLEDSALGYLPEEIKEEHPTDSRAVKRSTRVRKAPKHLDDDPDWVMGDTPKRKRGQGGKGSDAGREKSHNATDDEDDDDTEVKAISGQRKRRRVALKAEAAKEAKTATKGELSIAATGGPRQAKTKLSDVRRMLKLEAAVGRKPKKSLKFVRFGKVLSNLWQDDSMMVRDMPPFKCRRCQYRFFHASALCLHSLHKHAMQYPTARAARVVNMARGTLAAKRTVMKRGGVVTCRLCDARFANRAHVISHFQRRHMRTTLKCVRCDSRLNAASKNTWHRCDGAKTKVHVPRVIFCRHCPRQFRHASVIAKHYEEEHPEESYEIDMFADVGYQCRHCGRTFVRLQHYLVHLFGHGLNDKEVDLEFSDPSRVALRCTVYCEPDDHDTMPYKCPDCEHRFSKPHRLDVHMMNKHKKRATRPTNRIRQTHKVYCAEEGCDKVFSRMPDLREHVKAEHRGVMYHCPFSHCKYSTSIKAKYDGHMRSRHEEAEDRQCPHCHRQFDKKHRLKVHMVSKHGVNDPSVKMFKCDHEGCDYVAFARYSLEVHKNRHVKEKQHPCDYCGKRFKTSKSVVAHIKNTHLNIRPWICDVCGAAYSKEHELKKHITRHNDDKQYKCDLCDYATHDKGNFQSHLFSKHERFQDTTGVKNVWTCELCGYKCTMKHRIQEHMDSHNQVKRHVCQICGAAFVARYSLNYHIRKVHEGVTFECKHCTFKAPTKTKLNFHERTKHTHVGVKPYKCFYCDFHSANSGNVNKHVLKKHPGMKYKWVKVGTFDSLPPHHDLKAKSESFKPLAIANNQQFTKMSLLKKELQTNDLKSSVAVKAEIKARTPETAPEDQFFLMTQVENGVPVVKLISKGQLDELNAQQAAKGEQHFQVETAPSGEPTAEEQITMHYTTPGISVKHEASQLVDPAAAAMQLSEEQLQVLDDNKDEMQVIYIPPEMMGSTLVIEDGSGSVSTQAGTTFTTQSGETFTVQTPQ